MCYSFFIKMCFIKMCCSFSIKGWCYLLNCVVFVLLCFLFSFIKECCNLLMSIIIHHLIKRVALFHFLLKCIVIHHLLVRVVHLLFIMHCNLFFIQVYGYSFLIKVCYYTLFINLCY